MKRRWKRKIIFEKGKYIFLEENKTGKDEEYIWSRKICFFAEEKINSRGKGGKYLEKENMLFAEEKNNGEGKGGSFARGQSTWVIICKRLVHPDDHLQKASQSCPPERPSKARNGKKDRVFWSTRYFQLFHLFHD